MATTYYETAYMPPTNTRGAFIKVRGASSGANYGRVPYNYELGAGTDQHLNAVREITGRPYVRALFMTRDERGYVIEVSGE